MAFSTNSISTFKNGFNGGTRPNRFEVELQNAFPTGISVLKPNQNEKFKIIAASLPRAELGTIPVPYRGRILNFAGDRDYQTWAISIYDDNNVDNLWRSFQHWKERMDGHVSHQVGGGTPINDFSFKKLQTNWTVHQLDLNGGVLRTITLINCWPNSVLEIPLAMDQTKISGFQVSIVFDYFNITKGI